MHQNVLIFLYMPEKNNFEKKKAKYNYSFVFILFSPRSISKVYIITTFMCHGSLHLSTRAPLLPLPLQNPLDHVSG